MTRYEAPAKLNLSLLVSPPRSDGYHPIESMVQTVEWCDSLVVRPGEEGTDNLESDIEENLVLRALSELRRERTIPPLDLALSKEIPVAAGLGGGSSDAAAVILAAAEMTGATDAEVTDAARRVGADVPLFFTGGTLIMRGAGEEIELVRPLVDFAVAVVVPRFGLATLDVYQRWDGMEGPEAAPPTDDHLPPSLRGGMPMRNDLLPAAIALEPRLGDFMSDVMSAWATPVFLTGSGSACFGYFTTLDEATDAAAAVSELVREGRGVALRPRGVARGEDPEDE